MEFQITCLEGLAKGDVFRFQESRILIGRSSRCDLNLDGTEDGVSGKHCEITIVGAKAFLDDAGSTNGTFLAGKPVQKTTLLTDGATFRLGRQGPIFRFQKIAAAPKTAMEQIVDGDRAGSDQVGDRAWKVLFFVSLFVLLATAGLFAYLRLSP